MPKPDAAHLTGQDEETQRQRFAYLKGKNLLFISGSLNWPSVPAPTRNTLQEVRRYGLKITMVMHLGNEHTNYSKQVCDTTGPSRA
jgi:hypothetical protein